MRKLQTNGYNVTRFKAERRHDIQHFMRGDINISRSVVSTDHLRIIFALCLLSGITQKDLGSMAMEELPWTFLKFEPSTTWITIVSPEAERAMRQHLDDEHELASTVVSSNIGVLLKCL